jgi:hypoxanthine phosphoribosyltransferase
MPLPKVMITAEQIAARVRDLGQQITRDYRDRHLVLVPILKGSFLFAADLARAIDLEDVRIDFLGLRSYGAGTETSGVVQITYDLTAPIADQDVLIIEDIVDTGLSMRYLLDNLATRHPRSVKLCSLLHKPARTRARVPIDYLGFTIDDHFVVGYGLDHAEKYRNLPYIGVVTE